ncbi:MAG: hypothetical protein ACTSPW_19995 [Promethearchaeota archaeon]
MVRVEGGQKFAFSTIFTTQKTFTPYDIPLDNRMIYGLGEDDLKKIKAVAHITTLGTFLNKNPEELASKIKGKSIKQIKDYQEQGWQAYQKFSETIKNPDIVVETAIDQCFELFNLNYNRGNMNNYKVFEADNLEMNIRYRGIENCIQLDKVIKKSNKRRAYAYEVKWIIYDVEWDKWKQILYKMRKVALEGVLSLLIPGIGKMIGSFIDKGLKKKSEDNIKNEINLQFNSIFKELLVENMVIDYIAYGDDSICSGKVFKK